MNAVDSLYFFRSEILLTAAIFAVLILDFFILKKKYLGWASFLAVVIAFMISPSFYPDEKLFFNYYIWDPFNFFFRAAAYLTIALTILASLVYDKIPQNQRGELYVMLLTLAILLTVMGGVTNLLMIFLAIESVSLISYLLVVFQKFDKRSSEAALKYVLFGSVSSAVMLFGMSFIFGAAGTIDLIKIGTAFGGIGEMQTILLIGMLLTLVGIGFKISMVPFHMWAPDVYQGAPTPITAFLTVAPKALGFAVMTRFLMLAFPHWAGKWAHLLVGISILTMTVGNLVAISQSDIKRLLAYSSIAQAGYILAGLAMPGSLGLQAMLIYIAAYLFTNLGAFFTVTTIEQNIGSNQIEAYNGLSRRNPLLALALSLFLLSLAGIPPLAGFIGKIYIFSAAINANQAALAVAIALNSAVAAYYYFKIIKAMYLTSPSEIGSPFKNPIPIKLAVCICLLGIFLLGLWPAHIIRVAEQAIVTLPSF